MSKQQLLNQAAPKQKEFGSSIKGIQRGGFYRTDAEANKEIQMYLFKLLFIMLCITAFFNTN